MGLENGKCDSCEKEVNFLFPIAVPVELPTGGLIMRIKYYCIDCYETLRDVAFDELEEEENEDNNDENNDENEDNIKWKLKIKNIKVQCYKCKKWTFIDVTDNTKYWNCPNCGSLNGVEKE